VGAVMSRHHHHHHHHHRENQRAGSGSDSSPDRLLSPPNIGAVEAQPPAATASARTTPISDASPGSMASRPGSIAVQPMHTQPTPPPHANTASDGIRLTTIVPIAVHATPDRHSMSLMVATPPETGGSFDDGGAADAELQHLLPASTVAAVASSAAAAVAAMEFNCQMAPEGGVAHPHAHRRNSINSGDLPRLRHGSAGGSLTSQRYGFVPSDSTVPQNEHASFSGGTLSPDEQADSPGKGRRHSISTVHSPRQSPPSQPMLAPVEEGLVDASGGVRIGSGSGGGGGDGVGGDGERGDVGSTLTRVVRKARVKKRLGALGGLSGGGPQGGTSAAVRAVQRLWDRWQQSVMDVGLLLFCLIPTLYAVLMVGPTSDRVQFVNLAVRQVAELQELSIALVELGILANDSLPFAQAVRLEGGIRRWEGRGQPHGRSTVHFACWSYLIRGDRCGAKYGGLSGDRAVQFRSLLADRLALFQNDSQSLLYGNAGLSVRNSGDRWLLEIAFTRDCLREDPSLCVDVTTEGVCAQDDRDGREGKGE